MINGQKLVHLKVVQITGCFKAVIYGNVSFQGYVFSVLKYTKMAPFLLRKATWRYESQKHNHKYLNKCTIIETYCKDSFSRAILSDLQNFRTEKELDGNLTNIF